MSVLENLKLFSLGHVISNLPKLVLYLSVTYAVPWSPDYAPNGTSIWSLLIWSFATLTSKVMFFKFQMIGRSCSFWTSTDLNGASGSTITSNPHGWFLVPHNPLFCGYNVIKFVKVSSCRNIRRKGKDKNEWLRLSATLGCTFLIHNFNYHWLSLAWITYCIFVGRVTLFLHHSSLFLILL